MDINKDISDYEGLIRKTAAMIVKMVEEDYDDICQTLRIKVWYALERFDPAKSKKGRDSFIYSCVKNQAKDICKKKKRGVLLIEDIAPTTVHYETGVTNSPPTRDNFEARYLEMPEEQAFASILGQFPTLPDSLGEVERKVVALLYFEFSYGEIVETVPDIETRKEVGTIVKGIREKLADWKPPASEPNEPVDQMAELLPFPVGSPRSGVMEVPSPSGGGTDMVPVAA